MQTTMVNEPVHPRRFVRNFAARKLSVMIRKSLQVWSAFSGILDEQIFQVATNKDDRVIMSNVKFQVPKIPISSPFIKKDKTFGSQPEKTCFRGLRTR